jgi:hypothetical protein
LFNVALSVPTLNPFCVLLGDDKLKLEFPDPEALVTSVVAAAASVTPAATVAFVGIPVITPSLFVSVK